MATSTPHVLVLGAGQLARMMALAAAPLNIKLSAYDVTSDTIVHPLTQATLGKGLDEAIEAADVITAEFEHIPHDVLEVCEKSGKFLPTTEAIKAGGDRRLEKTLLDNAKVNNAPHAVVTSIDELKQAAATINTPLVLKSALGGYDGKGQWRLMDDKTIDAIWPEIQQCIDATEGQAIVAEAFIPFDREVSLVGARGRNGEVSVYPLAENVHTNGVLTLSTAIDDSALQQQAETMFRAVAESLDYVGVLALEFFDVGGRLLVNEIAPRVHNSGHWTQQGAVTCQFENHIRAVCGLPLGSTECIRSTSMINILGEDTLPAALLEMPDVHIHWYGKEKRPGRKMGHINVCAKDSAQRDERIQAIAQALDPAAFPALATLR